MTVQSRTEVYSWLASKEGSPQYVIREEEVPQDTLGFNGTNPFADGHFVYYLCQDSTKVTLTAYQGDEDFHRWRCTYHTTEKGARAIHAKLAEWVPDALPGTGPHDSESRHTS